MNSFPQILNIAQIFKLCKLDDAGNGNYGDKANKGQYEENNNHATI